ncbi:deoxycytidine kinase [Sigmodon hispidus]
MAITPKRFCASPCTSSEGTRIKRISIEGNITAGKSTFVNILKQVREDWEVVPQPVARWSNVQNTQDEFEELTTSQKSEKLHYKHESCLLHQTLKTDFDYLQEEPILTLNVNEDFQDKRESLVEKVKEFLSTL